MELARITILENNVTGTTKCRILHKRTRIAFYNSQPKHKYLNRNFLSIIISLMDLSQSKNDHVFDNKKLKKTKYTFFYNDDFSPLHECICTQLMIAS